jgi:hypothetical protein
VLLGVAVATTSASPVHAYRPFDGTDAAVAARGEVELELGPIGFYGRGTQHYLVVPATILNFGVVDRVELVLQGYGYYLIEPALPVSRYRVLETGLFLKGVLREGFLQGKPGTSIATELGTPCLRASVMPKMSVSMSVLRESDCRSSETSPTSSGTHSEHAGPLRSRVKSRHFF